MVLSILGVAAQEVLGLVIFAGAVTLALMLFKETGFNGDSLTCMSLFATVICFHVWQSKRSEEDAMGTFEAYRLLTRMGVDMASFFLDVILHQKVLGHLGIDVGADNHPASQLLLINGENKMWKVVANYLSCYSALSVIRFVNNFMFLLFQILKTLSKSK